jgi:hypothetical protein
MADDGQRRALLGRLAGLSWFARHGEVAATQALAILLEELQLREALLRHLGEPRGRTLVRSRHFSPSSSATTALGPTLRVRTFEAVHLWSSKQNSAQN